MACRVLHGRRIRTDRYPPFTLGEAPAYPARLEITYPEHLPRGFRLIGRWLLGIPHYIVAGAFAGGSWFAVRDQHLAFSDAGLVSLLAVIAAAVLLFTDRYPRSLFDFLLGLDRWVLRVAAYVAFLADEYPPSDSTLASTSSANAQYTGLRGDRR